MKIQTNSLLSQVGKLFLTQKFSNRTISFAAFIFNQVGNDFHFQAGFSQISLKTFIKKIKRLNGRLLKCKKASFLKKKSSLGNFPFFVLKKTSAEI